jgi:hypothetical protein
MTDTPDIGPAKVRCTTCQTEYTYAAVLGTPDFMWVCMCEHLDAPYEIHLPDGRWIAPPVPS